MVILRNLPRICGIATASVTVLHLLLTPATLRAASEATAEAEEDAGHAVQYGFEFDVLSRYVWRGAVFSERVVAQPSVWVGAGGTSLSLWGNAGLRSQDDGFDELDIELAHERAIGGLTLAGAAQLYLYPGLPDPSTGQLQMTASHPLGRGFGGTALASVDVIEYPGASFFEASLTHDGRIGTAALKTAVRWGHGSPRFVTTYLSDQSHGVDLLGGTLALEFEAGGLTLRPHVVCDRPVGRTSRELLAEKSPVVFGFAIEGDF